MEESLRQAISDFELFLSGSRAPALIGHSLATVVEQDVRLVASVVARWVYADPAAMRDRFSALLAGRNKVFDVFFYRIVRFQRIYDFFPPFERALTRAVPQEDQARLAQLLEQYPWKEIRPLGSFRDPQEFALEGRKDSGVSAEVFNEDLYRNITHQVLSADRRFTFDTQAQLAEVAGYQNQVAEVFDDFVNLLPDAQRKREIKLANAADADAEYANKPRFQIEGYISQLADLSIALFNDDYFEHGVKVFGVAKEFADKNRVNLAQLHRFQEKTELFNLQKLGEYGTTRTGTFLMRDVLKLFSKWYPDRLLTVLAQSDDRRERKLALSMLEAYGREIYGLLLETLSACNEQTAWYYTRNIAYLLGRIVTDDASRRGRAVELLAGHLYPGNVRQVNQQVIQALAFVADDAAIRALAGKLYEFEPLFEKDRDSADVCHKIVTALIQTETEPGLQAAFQFCEKHELLEKYRDVFNQVTIPDRMRAELVSRVRREIKKLKFSFSILGDKLIAREILGVVGHQGPPDVEALLTEVEGSFAGRSELGQAARRARSVAAPPPLLAADRYLNRILIARDLPQIFCHVYETGSSGVFDVESKEGIAGDVALAKGAVVSSHVPRYFLEGDNAFEWIMLLEPRELKALRFRADEDAGKRSISTGTEALIREALFQRGQVEQILSGVLSQDSKYKRREVHEFFTRFDRLERPERFQAVWAALSEPTDLKTLQEETQLNRYEVCKVVFYFIRQNMVAVVDASKTSETSSLDDALVAVALAVRQIEAKPVHFQTYFAAAEACAYLRGRVEDEAMRTAARGLRNFFLDAYSSHRVFVAKHIEVCTMTLNLMARYLKIRGEAERRELIDFVAFTFGEKLDDAEPAVVAREERSLIDKIESIDAGNDPFDAVDGLFGDLDMEDVIAAFDQVLSNVIPGAETEGPGANLSASEEQMLLDLFGNIASAYVRPFKEFVRELDENHRANRPTTADWLDFALPSISLLSGAAEKMGYAKLHAILARLAYGLSQQRAASADEDPLPRLFCERVLVENLQLSKLLPSTFSLKPTDDEIASRKEGLIVKFILKQIPEVDELVVNKIVFAGLGAFDRFMEIPSEEIAHVTGITQKLAETIYMKFYQYRDLYYRHTEPEKMTKFVTLFDISLSILREIHGEIERLAAEERARRSVDAAIKQGLIVDRQRTLWSLFALLCIKGEHDLVERVQTSVYEERIRLLEEYYARLAAAQTFAAA